MPLRQDIVAVTLTFADGSDIEYDGADITCSETITETAEKGTPPGKGTPVRYMQVLIHMAPDPTLAKGHKGGI